MRLVTTVSFAAMLGFVGLAPAADPAKLVKAASIHVILPASATLTLNGEKTTQTGGDRWFITPPLDAGKTYTSTIKIEFVRDGSTVTVERKVTLRSGRVTEVNILPKQAFAHFHDDHPAPIAPVVENDTEWPSDWTGN